MLRFLLVLGILFTWTLNSITPALAADTISIGIANYVPITGNKVEDGDIITFNKKAYVLSSSEYDPGVIGVIATKPAVSLSIQDGAPNTYPVVSSGNVEVKVSSVNGNIKERDIITTSSIPGVGMKATKSGYILGTALESYSSKNPKQTGTITVSLNLHYASSNSSLPSSLKDIFNLSLLATYESPSAVFKYFMAGLVVVIACIIGFLSFGKAANTGVEALGRNPLAGKMIQFGIFLNVLISIAIVAAGVAVAIVIIRL